MKILIVNDGRTSINAEAIERTEVNPRYIDGKARVLLYVHTKNDDDFICAGRYEKAENAAAAFDILNQFLGSDKSGILDILTDQKVEKAKISLLR